MRNTLSFAVFCRLLANLCGVVTAFLTIRLYNLYVSKEIYGTIIVGLQIIGYLQLMSGGFRMALNQQTLAEAATAEKQAIARFGQTLQSWFFVLVVFGGMAIMTFYSQLPHVRGTAIPLFVFVSAGLAAAVTFQAGSQLALLVALGEQATSALIQGGWGLCSVAVLWISFSLGSGVWAFPLSNGIAALLVILVVRIALAVTGNDVPLFVWRREPDFLPRFQRIWRPALACLYSQVATAFVLTIDLVLVGVLIGPGAAAVYGVVGRIMAISRQVLQSLSEAAWPRLAQETDGPRKAEIMRKVDRLNAWLVGAWFGAMALTLIPFLGWLVKTSWVATPSLAALILCRNFIIAVINPHAYGLLGAGRFGDLARVSQQEVILGLITGPLLAWRLGVDGMALGFLLATLSSSGWLMTRRYFATAHETHWFAELTAVYLRAFLAAGLSIALAAGMWHLLAGHTAGWLALLVGGIAFVLPAGLILLRWRLAGRVP